MCQGKLLRNMKYMEKKMISWRNYFSGKILDRGKEYWKMGMVESVEKVNDCYTAWVKGRQTYYVKIWNKPNGQLGMSCSCPYAMDGLRCKHMAAVCMEISDKLSGTEVGSLNYSHSLRQCWLYWKKN